MKYSKNEIRPAARRYRVSLGLAAALAGLAPALPSFAQGYPSRPVRLVIPYPPGGGIDLVGRPLAQRLGESLGQTVIVDNKGGASGMIAMEDVAKAPPDGHTIVLALNTQLAVNPALFSRVPYDPFKDFVPVALLGWAPYMLVVNPKLPVKDVKELVALARAKPGSITYASSGNGSGAHLAAEMIKTATGTNMLHVPYKATAEGVRDVISGEVQMMFATIGTVAGHVKAGTLRALAVSGMTRSPAVPDVPTVIESGGLPGFEATVWYGILAPAGTPRDIVARLNADILKAIGDPEYKKRLAIEAVVITGSTPEEFASYMKSESGKWAQVVKASGAKVD
jgi:tripartite-type tricarboxylate transporter receptor subunit TctC